MTAHTLSLPWPPSEVNPNRSRKLPWWKLRGRDRSGRATGAVTVYREHCFYLARNYMNTHGLRDALAAPVTVDITFFPPDRRERDPDNLIASLKPAIDGLVDAGLLAGDSTGQLQFGKVRDVGRPFSTRLRGCVLLELRAYTEGPAS